MKKRYVLLPFLKQSLPFLASNHVVVVVVVVVVCCCCCCCLFVCLFCFLVKVITEKVHCTEEVIS